jgi:hypothetical protein
METLRHSKVGSQTQPKPASYKSAVTMRILNVAIRIAPIRAHAKFWLALLLVAISTAVFVARSRPVARAATQTEPEHVLSFAYYSIKGHWDSTLTLNNSSVSDLVSTVTLYSLDGQLLELPSLSVKANSNIMVTLSDLISAAQQTGKFQEGSLDVRFNSNDSMAIAPQLTVSDSKHGLSFDMEPPMMLMSSSLEGLWWSPDNKTSGAIMLSNTTDRVLDVLLNVEWRGSVIPASPMSLSAHQTAVLEIEKLLKDLKIKGEGIERGGFSISHSGLPGALIAHGMIHNNEARFASNLAFVDPAIQKTSVLSGTGLMLAHPVLSAAFLEASFFRPKLALKNASTTSQIAIVTVEYTTNGVSRKRALPSITLAPHEVLMADFTALMFKLRNTSVSAGGLRIESTGAPGSLVAVLSSVDESRSIEVDVPLVSRSERSAEGGNHPFRLDETIRPIAYLTNITQKPTKVLTAIFHGGGLFTPELISVGPGATIAIDLMHLRDSQVKDVQGRTLPGDLSEGQFFWHPHQGQAMIGRVVMLNNRSGTANNFSCRQCCDTQFDSLVISPDPLSGVVSDSQQMTVYEYDNYCGYHSILYGPYNVTSDCQYSSNNTAVATVSGPGFVNYVGLGSTTISLSKTVWQLESNGFECVWVDHTVSGDCGVTVQLPELVGVFTSLVSGDNNATISGQAFTLQIQARVPGSNPPRVVASFSNPVTVSLGSMISGESISQSPVTMSQGAGQTQVVIKVIDVSTTPSCCRTYVLAASEATSTTGQVKVWFPVTMDIERWKNCNFAGCPNLGSYFCTSACAPGGFSSPFPFIALTDNACGAGVTIKNTSNGVTQSTTVLDLGPTTGNAYWNSGNIPSIGGCISDSLADSLGVPYGCNPNRGQGSVIWRFQ